jgi:hypothetical protein
MPFSRIFALGLFIIYGIIGVFSLFNWTASTEKDTLQYKLGTSVREGSLNRASSSRGGGTSGGK